MCLCVVRPEPELDQTAMGVIRSAGRPTLGLVFAPGELSREPALEWSLAKDSGVRFDLCNITIQPAIKKTRCEFWHETVDTYWEIEKWCVVGSLV